MRRKEGFTLIELLIVVAIIAILAAIAVPNFLEAQIRSKVSRIKSDFRTLATAEEAYFVDWNSYTFGLGGTQTYPLQWAGFQCLTTPIAYTTSLPLDPFGITSIGGSRRLDTPEFGVGVAGVGPAGRSFTDPLNATGMPSNTYEIESDGPDHDDNTGGSGPLPSTGSYPTGNWLSYGADVLAGGIYDPTNGTISRGEIFRVGGVAPGGVGLMIWWNMAGSR